MVPVITGSNRGLVAQDPSPGLHRPWNGPEELVTNPMSRGTSRSMTATESSRKRSVPHNADPADRPLGGIQHKDRVGALGERSQIDQRVIGHAQDQ